MPEQEGTLPGLGRVRVEKASSLRLPGGQHASLVLLVLLDRQAEIYLERQQGSPPTFQAVGEVRVALDSVDAYQSPGQVWVLVG